MSNKIVRIAQSGANTIIGNSEDDGSNKLQVIGSTKITGNLLINGHILVGSGARSVSFENGILKINADQVEITADKIYLNGNTIINDTGDIFI